MTPDYNKILNEMKILQSMEETRTAEQILSDLGFIATENELGFYVVEEARDETS